MGVTFEKNLGYSSLNYLEAKLQLKRQLKNKQLKAFVVSLRDRNQNYMLDPLAYCVANMYKRYKYLI